MKQTVLSWLESICRVGLGMLFIYSAWSKVDDPGLFAEVVKRYEILPLFAIGLFSLVLPMIELLTGLMFILTKWLREAALFAVGLLIMFIVALAIAVVRGLEIDCGCFGISTSGGRSELLLAIGRDVVLLVPAVWLMLRQNVWIGFRGLASLFLLIGICYCAAFFQRDQAEDVMPDERIEASPPKKRKGTATHQERTARKERTHSNKHQQVGKFEDVEDADDDLSPAERKLQESIDAALDAEDVVAVRTLAAQALTAKSADVRRTMVDALGWFGVKALPELTPFLADADEDVRESAMNEWTMAVSDIEDASEKLGVVELAMNVLNEEESLEDISNEYIGVDEKLAVESLLRVIEAGGSEKGIAKAKETYEFVTGETFTDRAAAEKWILEEYEPPVKEQ